MHKIIFLFLILSFFVIFIFYKELNKEEFITFNLQGKSLKLLVADEEREWLKGLSGIYELKNADGMIFIFPDKKIRSFWNNDTHLDLIVYWLEDDQIVGIDYLPSIEKTKEIRTITSLKEVNKVIEYVIKKDDDIFIFQPLPNGYPKTDFSSPHTG